MQSQMEHETAVAETKVSAAGINTEELSLQLGKVAAKLTPKAFRKQFGRRYHTLLAATGIDWEISGDAVGAERKSSDGGTLSIRLEFPKGRKYLLLSRALTGLTDSIVGKVVDDLCCLVNDWSLAVSSDHTASSEPESNGSDRGETELSPRVISSSNHIPDFTPSRLAHKLRNYLTPIISGAGQIQETARIEGQDDQASMAQIVVLGARHQDQLLNRFMLAYGPVEIRRGEINLVDLLHSILSAYRSRGHRSLEIGTLPEEILCYQDDTIVRNIYCELIDNALDAAGDTPIAISLTHDEDSTSLQVVSPGNSTVAEIEGQFFSAFYSRKGGHDGLGLPIARRLARELGGDVRCSTAEDAICFEVIIPRNLNNF